MKKKWILYIYYLLLLMLYLSWNDLESVPGAGIRIGYMMAVILPCYLYEKAWLPAVMTIFLSLCTHGLSTAYLPARHETYILVLLVGLFWGGVKRRDGKTTRYLFFLLLYTTLINLITSVEISLISKALLIVLILSFYIDYRDEDSFSMLSLSLIVTALLLSVSLLINADKVITVSGVSQIDGAERLGFRDINYSACVVALGMIAALIEIVRRKAGRIVFIISLVTLVVSFVALAMNASRGSFLSLAGAGIIILWFSRANKFYKVLLTLAVIAGVYYMYTNEMFDLLVARFEEDDGTGSGRLYIWQRKLEDFSHQGVFSWIFGMGHTIGREFDLSNVGGTTGFHNDFLAFLVCYGIIGFIGLLVFFTYPLRHLSKYNQNRPLVIAALFGVFLICMTLEPFVAGRIPYYMFWIYIVWLAKLGEVKTETKTN